MIQLERLGSQFTAFAGRRPERIFRAPGRVNLIGEHTDYNDGFVLPIATDLATYVAGAPRDDRRIRARSGALSDEGTVDLDGASGHGRRSWLDAVEGMARRLEARGARLGGADLYVATNIPLGAGLSSSAALETALGVAMLGLSGDALEGLEIARAAQETEHEFLGVRSGLMDPYTAVMARAGEALLLDCRSATHDRIPVPQGGVVIVVCDSRVKHSLASSEYNTRRAECFAAVGILREKLPHVRALRDVTLTDLDRWSRLLPDPLGKRCRHVIAENHRTLEAADALERADWPALGQLLFASHASLRDLYEVSCRELDLLVDLARSVTGVLGARMTGGGFGGCTVNLVHEVALARFHEVVGSGYARSVGIAPWIRSIVPSAGAGEISDEAFV